jgi:hypothetical protein
MGYYANRCPNLCIRAN